jgi:hypothetical protein
MTYTFKIIEIKRLTDYDITASFSLFGDGMEVGYSDNVTISTETLSVDDAKASEATITKKIEEKCKLYILSISKIDLLKDSINKDFPIK